MSQWSLSVITLATTCYYNPISGQLCEWEPTVVSVLEMTTVGPQDGREERGKKSQLCIPSSQQLRNYSRPALTPHPVG